MRQVPLFKAIDIRAQLLVDQPAAISSVPKGLLMVVQYSIGQIIVMQPHIRATVFGVRTTNFGSSSGLNGELQFPCHSVTKDLSEFKWNL